MKNLIVTRHPGLVEWLKSHGIEGEVKDRATEEDVLGKHVYGVLPYRLAARAELLTEVSMDIPNSVRGGNMTPEEMEQYNPTLRTWRVTEVFDCRRANAPCS